MIKGHIGRQIWLARWHIEQRLTQTPYKTAMWSDADALAKVNADLISNFIEGLKLANLTPKRFLLQTGAKHYGFHIGPATSPSFEADPR